MNTSDTQPPQDKLTAIAIRLALIGDAFFTLFLAALVLAATFLNARTELMVLIIAVCALGMAAFLWLYSIRGLRLMLTIRRNPPVRQISGRPVLRGTDFSADMDGTRYYCVWPRRHEKENVPAAGWPDIEKAAQSGGEVCLAVFGRFIMQV